MTNAAAIGYAIIAAKALGLNAKLIKQLETEMYHQMDFVSEDEAEEVYRNS